jgi:NADH:ubiquinone oxidoreductase subunit H
MNNLTNTLILSLLCSLIVLVGVLIMVAFLTLVERKLIGASQNRKGPNVVGPLGILQPFADALKLILKETVIPSNARKILFICSPIVSLFFALLS